MSRVIIQTEEFDIAGLYSDLRAQYGAEVGAVAMFVGLVRDHNAKAGSGETVSSLTLEHYPGMTEKSIERIIEEANSRWPLLDTWVIHRVGTMQPTEQIVAVLCASAHRDAAFAGAEFVMDYLKRDAVFWKKEVTGATSTWIESTQDDQQRLEKWQPKK
jgi:molybdopterin synthase catalytic subunit